MVTESHEPQQHRLLSLTMGEVLRTVDVTHIEGRVPCPQLICIIQRHFREGYTAVGARRPHVVASQCVKVLHTGVPP